MKLQVLSTQDYYPFGMILPGRSANPDGYRFGFNGQEKDDEVTGVTGSHLAFEYRIYDSRIGRFLSVDPLMKSFPMLTPYQYASNTPIYAIDIEGLEAHPSEAMTQSSNGNKVKPEITDEGGIFHDAITTVTHVHGQTDINLEVDWESEGMSMWQVGGHIYFKGIRRKVFPI